MTISCEGSAAYSRIFLRLPLVLIAGGVQASAMTPVVTVAFFPLCLSSSYFP